MKTIVTTLFLSFLSCCAFGQDKAAISAAEAACGPREVQFDITADKSQHPTPTPENGKALIYVVQENLGSTRVGADGKWLGGLHGGRDLLLFGSSRRVGDFQQLRYQPSGPRRRKICCGEGQIKRVSPQVTSYAVESAHHSALW